VVSFQTSSSYAQDLKTYAEILRTVQDSVDLALYQVAIGDASMAEMQWDISSVRVCYLQHITSELIRLHTLDRHITKPYAIDYFVSPVPHDGTCPKSRSKKTSAGKSPFHPFAEHDQLNTTVVLQGTRYPPLPELAIPPPLSAEGSPVVPVPEKSFLQKYWMYIGIVLFAFMITGSGPEEEQRRK